MFMLKELLSNLKGVDRKSRHRCIQRKIDKVLQKTIIKLQQELERSFYYELIKNSPLHKHQTPKLKLLYVIQPIMIFPLLTILNCMVSYKTCLNTSLTLCSQV